MATVLVIDDDPALRIAIAKILRKEGYRVFSAASLSRPLGMTWPSLVHLRSMVSPTRSDVRRLCRCCGVVTWRYTMPRITGTVRVPTRLLAASQ